MTSWCDTFLPMGWDGEREYVRVCERERERESVRERVKDEPTFAKTHLGVKRPFD